MECNKDEAARAKEIADRKATERDYAGAKKFALKAQSLYPGLEGLSQMLTTIDVHISAESKINGEVDLYSILGVNPWADDETVRKQYRKLALMLHPDKNKSIGADGAFKLVSEAWSVLSDKAKRLAYNHKRNSRGVQQKVPSQSGVSSATSSANGFHNSTSGVSSNAKTHNNYTRVGPNSVPSPSFKKPDTFWTICNRCKTQYEYLRIYLNHNLLCPNCHEAFLALEKAPPPNAVKSPGWSSRQQHQNSRHHASNSNTFNAVRNHAFAQNMEPEGSGGLNSSNDTSLQWGHFSRMAGLNSTVGSPSTAAQAASVVQQAHEKVKREREEAWAAGERARSKFSKKMGNSTFKVETQLKNRTDDNHRNWYGGNSANQMATGSGAGLGSASEFRRGSFETASRYGVSSVNSKLNSEKELSFLEIRNMLMEKAQIEICKKLQEWSSVTEAKTAGKEREKAQSMKQKSVVNGDTHDLNMNGGSAPTNKVYQNKQFFPGSSADDAYTEALGPTSINVPDPDFHNFDLDRTESSFGDDQVWAAYDDDDGMPRYYARIHKVISLKPFKMRISWLNSRSNSELGPLDWVGSGFSKTCGDFRTGRHEISETLNSFSHKVKWTKGARGVIHIFPRKGDVWALYRNWSPDWDEHTPDEVVHKYDMVEVLDDYNEDQGVSVTLLIKVAGFKTVFRKHMDPKGLWRIPKEEMFRFSHQVPNCLLTGQEAHNAPVGCRELDPAATPVELLQVITDANEAPILENSGKSEEEMLQSTLNIKVDEMMENALKSEEGEIENGEQAKDRDDSACLSSRGS